MHMENLFRLCPICFFVISFISCSNNNSNTNTIIIGASLEASISVDENCTTTINFEDLESNVYAYRADASFAVPAVQAGGHSTIDESTDLGFNIFIDLDDTERTNYSLDGSSGLLGTAYVFYIVGSTTYVSSDNNTGNLVVERLELDPTNGKVLALRATFNNVEIVNNDNINDVRCVNKFKITF